MSWLLFALLFPINPFVLILSPIFTGINALLPMIFALNSQLIVRFKFASICSELCFNVRLSAGIPAGVNRTGSTWDTSPEISKQFNLN